MLYVTRYVIKKIAYYESFFRKINDEKLTFSNNLNYFPQTLINKTNKNRTSNSNFRI